jgi:hypothetical protein
MNNRIVCHTHLGSVSLGSIQNPHLWSRRRRTTVLDCFYAGLQPLLQRRRLPTAITGSILPLLLVGDCFTAVAAVKIWLEQESTPHHARLLLVEGACAVIPLPTNCRRREKDGLMGVGYSHKPIKIDLHTHRHRERERERESMRQGSSSRRGHHQSRDRRSWEERDQMGERCILEQMRFQSDCLFLTSLCWSQHRLRSQNQRYSLRWLEE